MVWRIQDGFIIINGKKACNKSGKTFSEIDMIQENKTVYVIYFKGVSSRLTLQKDQFRGSVIDIKTYKRSKVTGTKVASQSKEKTQKSINILEAEEEPAHKKKIIGEFTVDLEKLLEPPETFKCRNVRGEWVQQLKSRMRKLQELPSGTILPVIVDPEKFSSVEEFNSLNTQINDCDLFLLGGNHLMLALKQLANEGVEIAKEMNILLYAGLTPEEARSVGNKHNFQMQTLPVTFQQKVEQARLFQLEGIQGMELVKKIQKISHEVDNSDTKKNKDSCSTLKAIATYTDANYSIFKELVVLFEQQNGCDRSIPQKLFRALQGTDEKTIFTCLSSAKDEGMGKTSERLEKAKTRDQLRSLVCTNLNMASWEEVVQMFPHIEIDPYIEMKLKRKFSPNEFLQYCKGLTDVPETQPPEEDMQSDWNVDISISNNGQQLPLDDNLKNIIELHKRIIVKAIQKAMPNEP